MTEIIQGVLKRISNKDLATPDQFGNVTRLSVLVEAEDGEKWVSLGTMKKPGLSIQKGKDWINVGVGSTILALAERNGDFLNGKRSDVKVLSLVEAGAPPKQQAPSPPTKAPEASAGVTPKGGSGDSAYWARKDAGAAASASVDKALAFYSIKGEAPSIPQLLAKARDMQALVSALADEIVNPPKVVADPIPPVVESAPAAKPSRKAVEKAKAEDFVDDDELPFG